MLIKIKRLGILNVDATSLSLFMPILHPVSFLLDSNTMVSLRLGEGIIQSILSSIIVVARVLDAITNDETNMHLSK